MTKEEAFEEWDAFGSDKLSFYTAWEMQQKKIDQLEKGYLDADWADAKDKMDALEKDNLLLVKKMNMAKEQAFDKYWEGEISEILDAEIHKQSLRLTFSAAWERQQKKIDELEAQVAVTTSDLQAALINEERYEKLRKIQPREFYELWDENFKGIAFDKLVDEL